MLSHQVPLRGQRRGAQVLPDATFEKLCPKDLRKHCTESLLILVKEAKQATQILSLFHVPLHGTQFGRLGGSFGHLER